MEPIYGVASIYGACVMGISLRFVQAALIKVNVVH